MNTESDPRVSCEHTVRKDFPQCHPIQDANLVGQYCLPSFSVLVRCGSLSAPIAQHRRDLMIHFSRVFRLKPALLSGSRTEYSVQVLFSGRTGRRRNGRWRVIVPALPATKALRVSHNFLPPVKSGSACISPHQPSARAFDDWFLSSYSHRPRHL